MAFKLRSGNKPGFKNMGSSPAKQWVGTEGQDQNKIFKNGEHVGDWVNGKKVMHTNKGKDKEFNRMIREHEFDHEKIVRPKEKKVIHRDIDDRELDKKEDEAGVGSGHNRKVMKDGHVNPTQKKKIADEKARYNALSPEQKKAEQDAANDKADKFHKRGKYAVKKKSPNKQKKLQPMVQSGVLRQPPLSDYRKDQPRHYHTKRKEAIIPDYHKVGKADGESGKKMISTTPQSDYYDPTYKRRTKLGTVGAKIANVFRSDKKDKNVKVKKKKK
jgi:hypothetical protein